LCFIAVSETGRKRFNDVVLRNLCGVRNFLWHCKEPRSLLEFTNFLREVILDEVPKNPRERVSLESLLGNDF
jgi:hypothetical protein